MAKNGILKNTALVGGFTALSRVLGLVREMLQARLIGAGMEQSAFALAFAIPNMARKLFGEGALTAAFVPVFKAEMESQAVDSARRLARSVMTMSLMMLVSIVIVVFLGLECVVQWRAELELSRRTLLTIRLIKTMLPYMIFICGAAFGMGVLNSLGRFKASSFMPCLLNFVWIGSLGWILFHPELRFDQRIHRVAMAILIAGAVQFAFMLWRMHCAGVTPKLTFSGWRDEKVCKVWRNTALAAIGAGAVQINYMLDQVLAQLASPWAAGVIGYAERLMDLPLGVIGVAFGTVLLPTFAGFFAKGDNQGAQNALSSSIRNMMFVMLPAAAGLVVLAPEITMVIYEGDAFKALDTMRVSRALAMYSVGLGFYGLQKSLVPWFQAQNDMKTPLKVSAYAVVLNAMLNIVALVALPEEWRHVGMAASTVVSALFSCILLIGLVGKDARAALKSSLLHLIKIVFASLGMAMALYFLKPHLATLNYILAMALLVIAGMAIYAALAFSLLSIGRHSVKKLER